MVRDKNFHSLAMEYDMLPKPTRLFDNMTPSTGALGLFCQRAYCEIYVREFPLAPSLQVILVGLHSLGVTNMNKIVTLLV
jgi:hypothetical protein